MVLYVGYVLPQPSSPPLPFFFPFFRHYQAPTLGNKFNKIKHLLPCTSEWGAGNGAFSIGETLRISFQLGVVMQVFNPSTQKAEGDLFKFQGKFPTGQRYVMTLCP